LPAEISIIQATAADAELLAGMASRTFYDAFAEFNTPEDMALFTAENFTAVKMREELSDEACAYFLAYDGANAAGFMKLNFPAAQTEFANENLLEIARLYVSKEFQNRQIGKQLIDHAIALAKELRFAGIWLGVWEKNPPAIRFYERQGFVKCGTHNFMLGTDRQTDFLMKLKF
jgi:diamine N-acetyltransferase